MNHTLGSPATCPLGMPDARTLRLQQRVAPHPCRALLQGQVYGPARGGARFPRRAAREHAPTRDCGHRARLGADGQQHAALDHAPLYGRVGDQLHVLDGRLERGRALALRRLAGRCNLNFDRSALARGSRLEWLPHARELHAVQRAQDREASIHVVAHPGTRRRL